MEFTRAGSVVEKSSSGDCWLESESDRSQFLSGLSRRFNANANFVFMETLSRNVANNSFFLNVTSVAP